MNADRGFTVAIENSDQLVACKPGQKMLDAFLRNNVWIPNSCNQGTCGTCKVRILSGTTDHPVPTESILSATDQDRGFILSCQSAPTSDIIIETPDSDSCMSRHVLRDFTGIVTGLDHTADNTVSMTVHVDDEFNFSAGQYVEIYVRDTGEVRQYSMANPPSETRSLEFHIRRQPDGLATDRWIFDSLHLGYELRMKGPWGDFVYDDTEVEAGMILLGGGTGLAPLKSIAQHVLSVNPDREIHVYHGVRNEADLYDVDHWRNLEAEHPSVRYVPCLSREQWNGRVGYVGDAMLEDFDSCKNYTGYLCGPPAMVDAGIKAFKRRRMSPKRIRREMYTPSPSLMTI